MNSIFFLFLCATLATSGIINRETEPNINDLLYSLFDYHESLTRFDIGIIEMAMQLSAHCVETEAKSLAAKGYEVTLELLLKRLGTCREMFLHDMIFSETEAEIEYMGDYAIKHQAVSDQLFLTFVHEFTDHLGTVRVPRLTQHFHDYEKCSVEAFPSETGKVEGPLFWNHMFGCVRDKIIDPVGVGRNML